MITTPKGVKRWKKMAPLMMPIANAAPKMRVRGMNSRMEATSSAVPMVQMLSHLPVIVDPSHSAGRRDLVVPLARAGIAVGADGVMVDVHPHPESALVDGAQALTGESLDELAQIVTTLPALLGRTSAAHRAG